ncbi:hypothetical protein PRK78_006273 [Emydomyces testavorans]|uniref:Uncharacterized protein n=1 Tax=Emydomyces testavorans TaxID=2070801 RepID=A0AAF0DPX6_9EURO|nr:hypothetical protein PRK78_006273 [Emydomyces testavorans]
MVSEHQDEPQLEAVKLSSTWNGDVNSNILLELKVKVKTGPSATLPILYLGDDIEARIKNHCIYHADDEEGEIFGASENWASPNYQSGERPEQLPEDIQQNVCAGYQGAPKQLYTSGMRLLSPSPTKERLFPPSPSTSSGHSSLSHKLDYDMTKKVADLRRCTRLLEEGKVHKIHELPSDSEQESNYENAPGQSIGNTPGVGDPSNKNMGLRDREKWMDTLHQREKSGTTIIHWMSKDQIRAADDQSSFDPGRTLPVSLSPRTPDFSVLKRNTRSRIPKRNENLDTIHRQVDMSSNFMRNAEIPGSVSRKPNDDQGFHSTQNLRTFRYVGSKLPTLAKKSGFSPVKAMETPTAISQEHKSSSEPGKAFVNRIQPAPISPTRQAGLLSSTASANKWDPIVYHGKRKVSIDQPGGGIDPRSRAKDLLVSTDVDPEADVFCDRGGRSSFVASWLHGRSREGGNNTMEEDHIEHALSESKTPWENQFDGPYEWQLENTDNRKGSKSPVLSDPISLPSPTPSSKLSMPWNSAEALVEKNVGSCSLLDLENVECYPVLPVKPEIENVGGLLSMRFLDDAARQIVVYEATIELHFNATIFENLQDVKDEPLETGDEQAFAVKWQVEYKPQRRQCVPKLSLIPISHQHDKANAQNLLTVGTVKLDVKTSWEGEECIDVYRNCEEDGTVHDEKEPKILPHQTASDSWLIVQFQRLRKYLESCIQKIRSSVPFLASENVWKHLKMVLQHYGFLVFAVLMFGGVLIHLINDGSYGISVHSGGRSRTNNCLPNKPGCQIPLGHHALIEARRTLIPGENAIQHAGYQGHNPGAEGNASRMEDKPLKDDILPQPTKEVRKQEAYRDNMPPRTAPPNVAGTGRPTPSTTLPATGEDESLPREQPETESRSVTMVSKDGSVRDRIDRFLGWKGPLVH